jgi:hypothetical protein
VTRRSGALSESEIKPLSANDWKNAACDAMRSAEQRCDCVRSKERLEQRGYRRPTSANKEATRRRRIVVEVKREREGGEKK